MSSPRVPAAQRRTSLSCALAVFGLFVAACGGSGTPDRGHDPWVFRSVMDLQPRMITFALGDSLWASYSTETSELYRVWPGGVNFAGPVYNQSHGPQPTSVGPAYLENDVGNPWVVRVDGAEQTPLVQYEGHRMSDGQATMMYRLVLDDGREITINESPSVARGRRAGIVREIRTVHVPENVDVVLLSGRSRAEATKTPMASNATTEVEQYFDTATVPPFDPEGDDEALSGMALIESANCQICHNPEVQTVGPALQAIAERYEFTPFNVSRLARRVIEGGTGVWGQNIMTPNPQFSQDDAEELVRFILSLDGETESRGPSPSGIPMTEDAANDERRGLAINVWRANGDIPGMLEPSDDDVPVFAGVVPGLNFQDADFGDFEEDFYLEARGVLNVEQAGTYVLRIVSDDGGLVYLDGALLIDNDGFHGPDPSDAELHLDAGLHPITIRFFQGKGGKTLSLQWVKPGDNDFSIIPADALTYRDDDLLEVQPFVASEPVMKGIPGDQIPLVGVHPAFTLETIRPESFQPMVGGLDVLPDGRVILSTWDADGAVYVLDNVPAQVDETNRDGITVTKIAEGLAEPLGLKVVDGRIFVLQKQELTELIDTDGDEVIDEYHTVASDWGTTANFHEFAFGLAYKDGYLWATLATAILPGGASADPQNPDRGKVIRIHPDTGEAEFVASGLRTPNGIGYGVDGELFVADNQGDWLPSSKIMHLEDGAIYGSRSVDFEGTAGVPVKQPVVWLPQTEIGNSPSQPAPLDVGPYAGQMIHGEVTHGGIKRVFVEEVGGEYQGAVFRFTQGMEAGVNRIVWGPDERLYVGGIGNPGNWQHSGSNWYGLQRLTYNGGSAFEMLAVRARTDGVELEFTEPLAPNDGFGRDAYHVEQWYYEPTEEYGGPKLGLQELPVRSVHVSDDRRRVFLELGGVRPGHVVYIRLMEPWISANGNGLWSREAWYTMNGIPPNTRGFRSTLRAETTSPNTLTAAQREAGWRLLFDGRTLNGWRSYLADTVGTAWRIEDGAITLGGGAADWQTLGGGDIMTDETFEDYEFYLEWRIAEGGNSGIIYNVVEDPEYDYVWQTGPEMQVLDNDRHPDGAITSHRAGELYDLIALPYDPTKPVGEWNSVRIVQRDGHLEHWMNGHKLLETQIGSPGWDAMVAASKFAEMPAFGKSTSGHIALQDHGDRVWFRNIRVRTLEVD